MPYRAAASMSIPFGMPSPRFSMIRYLRTNAATPLSWSQRAMSRPSRSMARATNAPPGAMITPVPVAFSGRYAVSVGVTTLKTTAPSGVSSTVVSFCVQVSEPGAAPGQMSTLCAPARLATTEMSASARAVSRSMSLGSPRVPQERGSPLGACSGHRRRELLHELILPLLHPLRREVFLVRRDAPRVPVRIGERAGAIAPELIRHGAVRCHLPARGHGPLEQRVAIVHVHPERRRRSTKPLRSLHAHHRVHQHDERIADATLYVDDLPVR